MKLVLFPDLLNHLSTIKVFLTIIIFDNQQITFEIMAADFLDLKKDVNKLIGLGKTDLAIELIQSNIDLIDKKLVNDLSILSNRNKKLEKGLQLGLIKYSESIIESNKINYGILEIIDEFELSQNSSGLTENVSFHKEEFFNFSITFNDIKNSIIYHLKETNNWSKEISFKDTNEAKSIFQVYIELNFYLTPKRQHFFDESVNESILVDELFDRNQSNLVILGQPGAGKTTTMKRIVQNYFIKEQKHNFPIVIRLRNLNNRKNIDISKRPTKHTLLKYIVNLLGIQFNTNKIDLKSESKLISEINNANFNLETSKGISILNRLSETDKKIQKIQLENESLNNTLFLNTVINLIDSLNVLLVLDGLDEVNESDRGDVILDIQSIALGLKESRLVLTSRTGDFHQHIENTTVYEVCPLSEEQAKLFISKWLNDEESAEELLNQIKDSPFADTTIRPLTLSHLCALYERYKRIPEKPKSVYRKIINLLLEEWDLQRNVFRESKYSKFEIDRKREFLANLAFHLMKIHNKSIFERHDLIEAYSEIRFNFGLPENECQNVINEIESHTGIFVQSGYAKYEFVHKSIQEYLAAEYIVKLPKLPDGDILIKMPSVLALVVAISSNPTEFFSSFIFDRFKSLFFIQKSSSFIISFLNRLVLEKPDFPVNGYLIASIGYINTLLEVQMENEHAEILDVIMKQKYMKESLKYLREIYSPLRFKNLNTFKNLLSFYGNTQNIMSKLILDFSKKGNETEAYQLRNDFSFKSHLSLPEIIFIKKSWGQI